MLCNFQDSQLKLAILENVHLLNALRFLCASVNVVLCFCSNNIFVVYSMPF